MKEPVFYLQGKSPVLPYVRAALAERGYPPEEILSGKVTHVLLPVPSFPPERPGGSGSDFLRCCSPDTVLLGGHFPEAFAPGYQKIDFLEDPQYLAENAAITAHCAVKLALNRLDLTLADCRVLVLGWGRIGKCLALLLKNMGAQVTVAARNPEARAVLRALGYETLDTAGLSYALMRFHILFNTVPAPILSSTQLRHCRSFCLKIDLASVPGLDSPDAVQARGLPAKLAPESSGRLIARTALRLAGREAPE